MRGLSNALRGINGEFEINRLVGAIGALAYIVGAHVFLAWNMIDGREFDIVAYCGAFPIGLGVAVGSIAGAVAWKDQKVAAAKVTERTGAIPAPPPDGPQVPVPEQIG